MKGKTIARTVSKFNQKIVNNMNIQYF